MKKYLSIFYIIIFLTVSHASAFIYYQAADSVRLIQDEPYNDALPRNFRKCTGGFIREYKEKPDTTGLNSLNISGSSEFSNKSLPLIINSAKGSNVTILDLRQEMHGFLNGMAVSWYGKYDWADTALSREEVMKGEKRKLDSLSKNKVATVIKADKKDKSTDTFISIEDTLINVLSIRTEKELTEEMNTGYFRITATDHRKPVTSDVDRFINFVLNLKDDYWVHFHCHAGDGRTTTFMVMFDMMKNAKRVAFEDIINRQYLIGGIDLTKDEDFPAFDKQYAIERTEFLRSFYNYCRENTDGFNTMYSSYINK